MDTQLSTILEAVSAQKQNEICTDIFLSATANLMEGIEDYRPFCHEGPEWGVIVKEIFMNDEAHRYTGLKLWKERRGHKATNRELIGVMVKNGNFQLAQEVASLLASGPTSELIMEVFKGYLAKYYNMLFPPTIPTHPHEVPLGFVGTCPINKKMIPQVALVRNGKEIHHVQLESFGDIFQSSKVAKAKLHGTVATDQEFNHVTIVEGVAGSGKSAMCWYMSNHWHKQMLFQEFPLFVFISLSDPAIRSARTLADFIPHPCEEMRKAVADQISKTEGEGLALVVDGIDEAPLSFDNLGSPFLEVLIDAIFSWKKAAVLVTSRPCSPQLKFLKSCVENYELIFMCGFSLSGALVFTMFSNQDKPLNKLLQEHVSFMSLSQLPFNAAIAAQIIRETTDCSNLPQTQTELVLAFLLQFIQKCTEGDLTTDKICEMVKAPHHCINWLLPNTLKQAFRDFGKIAIDMKASGTTMILANQKPDTLSTELFTGLMQGTTSFDYKHAIDSLQQRQYRFPHSIIQDFFIAFSLHYMESDKVVQYLQNEMKRCSISPVLSFYAGLTGLRKLSCLNPLLQHLTPIPSPDISIQIVLFLLLNAVYESQSREAIQYVIYQISLKHDLHNGPVRLELSSLPPYIPRTIYLPLAYFLVNVNFDNKLLAVNLANNSIDDEVFETIVDCLRAVKSNTATRPVRNSNLNSVNVILLMDNNALTHQSSCYLFETVQKLEQKTMVFGFLSLRGNWQKETTITHEALESLVLCVSLTPALQGLDISGNGITGDHINYITALLEGSGTLQSLNLSDNDIGSELSLLAPALLRSSLRVLSLSRSQLSDSALELLGSVLKENQSLECLDVSFNHVITTVGLTKFLACLTRNDVLKFLYGVGLPWVQNHRPVLDLIKAQRLIRGVKTELYIETSPSLDLAENFQLNASAMLCDHIIQQSAKQVCTLEHLEMVADEITAPEAMVAGMGIDFERISSLPPEVIAKAILVKVWTANEATYSDIIEILSFTGEYAAITKLHSFLNQKSPGIEHMVAICLVESYKHQPFFKRSLVSESFSDTDSIMFAVGLNHLITDSHGERKKVSLEQLVQQGKVILLEGVSGSGKTTYLANICITWALSVGPWFRDFKLVIKIPLDDPEIQRASCLADLIPFPYDELREAAAEYIKQRRGKGIVFMLDAIDCMSTELLQSSYLADLLNISSSSIPLAVVVIAAQPRTSNLAPFMVSNRASLPSFAEESKIELMFSDIIHSNNDFTNAINSFCAIPFYACVIANLLKFTGDVSRIPETRTTLIKWYLNTKIITFLKCYFPVHTPPDCSHDFNSVEDFGILPRKLFWILKGICRVAFQTLKDTQTVFTEQQELDIADTPVISDLCRLGIIQVTQHDKLKYEFAHSIFQEYLAALHLASHSQSCKVSLVSQLIMSPSFIFPFLSGLVSAHILPIEISPPLTNSLQTLAEILPKDSYHHRVLTFLHCIFESRSIAWCEKIFQQLQIVEPQNGLKLCLGDTSLSISDCMAIRYFFELCLKQAMNVMIDVQSCELDEKGLVSLSEVAQSVRNASYACLLLPSKQFDIQQASNVSWKELSDQILVTAFATLLCSKRNENSLQLTINGLLQGLSADQLNKRCSDLHLLGIANEMEEWKSLASAFLAESDVHLIEEHFKISEHQKFVMLKRWKDVNGEKATYNEIIKILVFTQGELHLGGLIKRLLLTKPSREQAFDFFCQYLRKCYLQVPPPQFSSTAAFHFIEPQLLFCHNNNEDSRLHKVYEHDAVDNVQYSIHVADIFSAGQIKSELVISPVTTKPIILLEGLAGSGKTTLVWYMCQKWAERNYYKQFKLLLLISSRDPRIHSAKSLPDFIPHPSEHVRNLVAKYIQEKRGEGVSFIIDDWSQMSVRSLPAIIKLRDSCLQGSDLNRAAMLMVSCSGTSRISVPTKHQKVVLHGFTPQQMYSYLCNHPEHSSSKLKQNLKNNPSFRALCQLPLYAEVALQTSEMLQNCPPPETQTEMVKNFILLKIKLLYEGNYGVSANTFADIPPYIRAALDRMGRLALYFSTASTIVEMTTYPEFQNHIHISLSLGLMEVCSGTDYGYLTRPIMYRFVHRTFEDFLEAYALCDYTYAGATSHLSWLTTNMTPCRNVLQFFAGLSGLHAGLDTLWFLKEVIKVVVNDDCQTQLKKRLWLLVIESIYEARSNYLCQYVLCHLMEDHTYYTEFLTKIDFSDIPEMVTQVTINAIGYFLSNIYSSTTIFWDLANNHIQDEGVSLLFHHIQKASSLVSNSLKSHKPIDLFLGIAKNAISHQGTESLCMLIQQYPFISCIDLHGNWNPPNCSSTHTDIDAALSCLVETVSTSTNLRLLDLGASRIIPANLQHLKAIVERCTALTTLYLSDNNIGSEGTVLVKALKNNSCIHTISFQNCNIDDKFISELGDCALSNQVLRRLDISLNPAITFEALLSFVNLLKQNTSIVTLFVTCSEAEFLLLKDVAAEIDRLRSAVTSHFELFNCPNGTYAQKSVHILTKKSFQDFQISGNHLNICSDEHLHEVAEDIGSEHTLSLLLGGEDEISPIKEMYPEQLSMQQYTALTQWKQLQGSSATYQALNAVFEKCMEAKATSKLFKILRRSSLSQILDVSAYLKDCYLQPCMSGIITASADVMVNYIPLTLTSKKIHESQFISEVVTERDILHPAHTILIEGVAGAGKSTLAQYMGKKWADGGLYNSYKLIIWVSLGDPEVQSAESLRDLIPFPVQEEKSAIATQIQSTNGEGVAFIFDGLDELPCDSSYTLHFLKEFHIYLPKAAVTILSRPGSLKRLTSSHRDWNAVKKVSLQGFNRSQLGAYFHKCLQDADACKKADKSLAESHTLQDLCKIPFYASIIACLLQFSATEIPQTRTGLLKSYLKYLLLNHIDTRTSWDQPLDLLPGDFHCLQHLKSFPVYENLVKVCKLAFITLQSSRTVFGTEELNQVEISKVSECMGLVSSTNMHITQLGDGNKHVMQKVQFVHSVVHQFLAALHLTTIDLEEQTKNIMSFIKANPPLFSPAFLAGIVSGNSNEQAYFASLHALLVGTAAQQLNPSSAQERLLLLLHCVFESQTSAMVEVMTKNLNLDKQLSAGVKIELSGMEVAMDETDFAAVGYFLAKLMSKLPSTIPAMVVLNSSDLNDTNVSAVNYHYCKDFPSCKLMWGLKDNQFSNKDELVCFRTPTLVWYDMIPATVESYKIFLCDPLKHLLESLSRKCKAEQAILLSLHTDDLHMGAAIMGQDTQSTPTLTTTPIVWKELHDFIESSKP